MSIQSVEERKEIKDELKAKKNSVAKISNYAEIP